MTFEDRAAKLRQAVDLVTEVTRTMDISNRVCGECETMHFENPVEHKIWNTLVGTVSTIERAMVELADQEIMREREQKKT